MKRKVIIILSVVLLFVSAIPCAFAAENDRYMINGLEVPNIYISDAPERFVWTNESGTLMLTEGYTIKPGSANASYVSVDSPLHYALNENDEWEYYSDGYEAIKVTQVTWSSCDIGSTVKAGVAELIKNYISITEFSAPFDVVLSQFGVLNAVEVLAVLVGACVGLVFMWWGARKLVRGVMKAFKKGKVSI